jgi:predicted XRE-type DNA-binding protein/phage-related protein
MPDPTHRAVEGDTRAIVRRWPKPIREDFGIALGEMQEGRAAALAVRPMPTIAPGVFELKDSDESKWYRMVYLARVQDIIYVLHCFTKNTGKRKSGTWRSPSSDGSWCSSGCERSRSMKSKGNGETRTPHVTRGNVLDDLGFSPSEALEIKVKAEIYRDLLQYIQERGFSQQELGTVLGIHQPDVSHLLHGKVSKFSVGKLIKFAGKLNLGAEVRLTKPTTAQLPRVVASGKLRKRVPASV